MLFNSYEFIFLFLPTVIAGYFLLGKSRHKEAANSWVLLASLFFYGWWDVRYLPLLLGSILMNYIFSGMILKFGEDGKKTCRKAAFLAGLGCNLLLLGWYKYLDFFFTCSNYFLGTSWDLMQMALPLGISFFTITQVLYLMDCYSGVTKDHDFMHYALFVSFFPHLLAGPILYHKPMMKQFHDRALLQVNWENMARGLSLFIIGLAKKVVIADSFIPFVNHGFAHTAELTIFHSWLVGFCYMFQLYFDFSGYSDMAVGMARMMNIKIPINFNSPIRAASLIEFWQRWHISLTNAITACIYFPIIRAFRKPAFHHMVFASFIAFFIVGIWHGAGWTYVVFALMHASGIAVNHIWKHYHLWMPKPLGHVVTMFYVYIGLMFFRAATVGDAISLLQGMAGQHGVLWPDLLLPVARLMGGTELIGWHPGIVLPETIFLLAILLVVFSPNSNEITRRMKPSIPVLAAFAILFCYTVSQLGKTTDFLYFQF